GGRAPMHPGQGPGLSLRDLGEADGSETVTLLASEIPSHSHPINASAAPADAQSPEGLSPARVVGTMPYGTPTGAPLVPMAQESISPAGGDQPHNNMMPYLAFYFCIALQGVFPPRT
ncbi:MAG TPA: phage tail protein, partial [Chiayiivirga sp.]|nr:phage tail protein [Chiayiivirga sp.]